jgi:hypothetical protein
MFHGIFHTFLLVIAVSVLFLFYETKIQLTAAAPPNVDPINLNDLQTPILAQIL